MKDCKTHYKYVATWVDNILVMSKEPLKVIQEFKEAGEYKLKGVGCTHVLAWVQPTSMQGWQLHLRIRTYPWLPTSPSKDLNLVINSCLIHWYCKRQNTFKILTYGSELIAGRVAVESIIDFRYRLQMLGVPIKGYLLLFGDNQSMIMNTTVPIPH